MTAFEKDIKLLFRYDTNDATREQLLSAMADLLEKDPKLVKALHLPKNRSVMVGGTDHESVRIRTDRSGAPMSIEFDPPPGVSDQKYMTGEPIMYQPILKPEERKAVDTLVGDLIADNRSLIAKDFTAIKKLSNDSEDPNYDLGMMVGRTNIELAKANGTQLNIEDDGNSLLGISKHDGADIYRIDKDGSVKTPNIFGLF